METSRAAARPLDPIDPIDRLRTAERLMRERADAVTSGGQWTDGHYWITDYDPSDPSGQTAMQRLIGGMDQPDATHYSAWLPTVALAVADSLKAAATDLWAHGPLCCAEGCADCDDTLWMPHVRRALVVADTYLGEPIPGNGETVQVRMSDELGVPVLLDDDGYPTDEALDFLRTFTGTAHALVDHLSEAMRAYGGVKVERIVDDLTRPVHRVYLATGGWSGNESIVGHLQDSFFWFAYWESSRRGGAYAFHVPESRWDEPMIEWPPALRTPAAGN